jgi:hypothetical protein
VTYLLEQVGQGLKLLKINLLLANFFYSEGRKNYWEILEVKKHSNYAGCENLKS